MGGATITGSDSYATPCCQGHPEINSVRGPLLGVRLVAWAGQRAGDRSFSGTRALEMPLSGVPLSMERKFGIRLGVMWVGLAMSLPLAGFVRGRLAVVCDVQLRAAQRGVSAESLEFDLGVALGGAGGDGRVAHLVQVSIGRVAAPEGVRLAIGGPRVALGPWIGSARVPGTPRRGKSHLLGAECRTSRPDQSRHSRSAALARRGDLGTARGTPTREAVR